MFGSEFARLTSKLFVTAAAGAWGFGAATLFTNYPLPSWLTNRFKWNLLSAGQVEYCKNQLRAQGVSNVDDYNYYSSHDLTGSYVNNLGLNIIVPPQFVASAMSSIGTVFAVMEDPLIKNKKIGDIDRIIRTIPQNITYNNVADNEEDNKQQNETAEFRSIADLKNLSHSATNNPTPERRRSRFWNWLLKDDENNIYKYHTVINSEEDKKHVTGEDWRQLFMEKYQKIPLTTQEQQLAWKYMAIGINEKHDESVLWASGASLFGTLFFERKMNHYKKEGILILAPIIAIVSIASLSFHFQSRMVKEVCKDHVPENAKLGMDHAQAERRFNLIQKKQQQSLFITRNGNDLTLFGAPLTRRIKLYKEKLTDQQSD
jgi:hypothetical protein